ncbi:MAG TPA: class I SAM-dependent methyltransferase [Gemmataceae bacterium]|jgi:2-polyprenyl-3-methyl-5-hydroxy-6-metoxy-1,4-benzoquinol methylase|nr:class I SAM-dependent methyltransferase [Gemmataceae bacterium]
MPTSDVHNIVPILTVVQSLQPRSVLDIGCGFGKYGVLLREYLDVWHERLDPASWQVRLVGIDAFARYRNPLWDYLYQNIHIGEAQHIVPGLGEFDLILIADVIEHLERPVAVSLVERCLRQSPVVIVSTPREFYPQQDTNQNPYEVHRILWTAAEFPPGAHVVTVPALSCNVFVASREPLPWRATYVADLNNVLYLRSRYRLRRLGPLGWPVSATLRLLNRCLA